MADPEWIAYVKGDKSPRPVAFEELRGLCESMVSLTLLWDTNCYHVNRERRFFMINGGRKIAVDDFRQCRDLGIFYRRRHSLDIIFGAAPPKNGGEHRMSYLLGFEGTVDDVEKQTFLQVSDDGKQWIWKTGK